MYSMVSFPILLHDWFVPVNGLDIDFPIYQKRAQISRLLCDTTNERTLTQSQQLELAARTKAGQEGKEPSPSPVDKVLVTQVKIS